MTKLARQSNIELFRILAMFMVLVVHLNGWMLNSFGGIDGWWDGGVVPAVVRTFIQSITCVGVDCFILISGYFSIKPKLKSILNLYSLLLFFYLGCYLLQNYLLGDGDVQIKGLIKNICAFSRENWFIQCYLFLMLFSPVLNTFVNNVKEKTLLLYIVVFSFCAFYFGCVHDSTYFYFNRGYSVTSFVLIYLVGRYVRLYGEEKLRNYSSIKLLIVWSLCIATMMLGNLFFASYSRLWCYCSPIQIISASLLLLLFIRIKIQSGFINWVGKSCLAVFILHTSDPFFTWIVRFNSTMFHAGSLVKWVASVVFVSLTVFIVSVCLDKVRLFFVRPILKKCDNFRER